MAGLCPPSRLNLPFATAITSPVRRLARQLFMSTSALETAMPAGEPGIDRAAILKAAATLGILGSGADSAPRMLALLCDPQVDGAEIAALIASQPSMYARVLRVANSSYYGHPRSITTMERALLLLGRDAVRTIAAATCFDGTMAHSMKGAAIDLHAVAHHSLTTAAAAEALATIARRPMASEAFIAGLLHNLGIAVQVHLDPRGVGAMIEASRNGAACGIRELEARHAVVGHEECLEVVFAAWQMPDSLVAAARHHHAPMNAPEPHRDLTALVNLGASLGLAIGAGHALEPAAAERDAQAMLCLGLTHEDVDAVTAQLPARVAELGSALFDP
jgi:HD-like signal output (HDOD) protein